jgi:putative cardiolipin synthase
MRANLDGWIASGLRVLAVLAFGLLAACAELPVAADKPVSRALTDTRSTRLALATDPLLKEHPGQAGLIALADGREAFATRMRLADLAERSIDLQTYIFHDDATGALMFDRLLRAADRGVRVRLLLDDNNTVGLDPILAMLDAHANIEVRLFNPFANRRFRLGGYLTDFSRLNRRMHNKSFTVDNQVTVVGGRNIGNEYFDAGQESTFVDLDVAAVGDIVRDVSATFDDYWNSTPAYLAAPLLADTVPVDRAAFEQRLEQIRSTPEAQEYIRALLEIPKVQDLVAGRPSLEWAKVRLVRDDPEKVTQPTDRRDLQMLPELEADLGKPTSSLDLVSPYFVPAEDAVKALEALARRGLRVRILTNSLASTDVSAVHAGYAKWRKDLLSAGVQLLELKPSKARPEKAQERRRSGPGGSSKASLHAKTFSVDRQRVFVGSFNLDPRSTRLNTEMGVVIDSPKLASALSDALDRLTGSAVYVVRLSPQGRLEWVDGDGTVYTTEPNTTALRRATVEVLSWLPIDWML